MEFGFRPEADGRPVLGLHERGSFDRLFALETCLIASPLTVEILNADGIPTRRPLGDVTVYQGQLSARLLPKRQEP